VQEASNNIADSQGIVFGLKNCLFICLLWYHKGKITEQNQVQLCKRYQLCMGKLCEVLTLKGLYISDSFWTIVKP